MPPAKVDYSVVERAYITSDVSYRDLEKKFGVSFSAISKYGRDHDWMKKREEYRRQAIAEGVNIALEKLAEQTADIRVEAVTAMRATLYEYIENLRAHKVNVGTKEAVLAIETLQLLLGEPTDRKEMHVVSDSIDRATPEELRELLASTRAKLVEGRAVEVGTTPAREAG
jgi:CRISPR/Cas system CSM-associated protein Csm2 small subunit